MLWEASRLAAVAQERTSWPRCPCARLWLGTAGATRVQPMAAEATSCHAPLKPPRSRFASPMQGGLEKKDITTLLTRAAELAEEAGQRPSDRHTDTAFVITAALQVGAGHVLLLHGAGAGAVCTANQQCSGKRAVAWACWGAGRLAVAPPTAVLLAEAFFSSSCGYAAVQASRSLVSYVDFLPVGCCCCRLLLAVRLQLTRAACGRL